MTNVGTLLTLPEPYVEKMDFSDLCYTPKCLACGGIDVDRDRFRISRCADCRSTLVIGGAHV